MVSITLSVPEQVRNSMKEFPEVNWTHLIRSLILQKVSVLKAKKEILNKLEQEENFNKWAVSIIREGRK